MGRPTSSMLPSGRFRIANVCRSEPHCPAMRTSSRAFAQSRSTSPPSAQRDGTKTPLNAVERRCAASPSSVAKARPCAGSAARSALAAL